MQIKFSHILFLCVSILLLVSCGSKKQVVTTKKQDDRSVQQPAIPEPPAVKTETDAKVTQQIDTPYKDVVASYVDLYAADAMTEMRLYKIPASITLAQGILESGSGRGRLAVEANNHFGVKCHTGWTGGRIYHDDDKDQECFRKYKDASYSYRDHSLFLTQRKRYRELFSLPPDDYESWARGLRAAGYATDRRYPQKLISLIERYQLYTYDAQVLGTSGQRNRKSATTTNQQTYKVKAGDTLYGISKKFNTTVRRIKLINNLSSDSLNIGDELLIESDIQN
jgi:flagellum-specific peptidoglycan hydrolase FlgJ